MKIWIAMAGLLACADGNNCKTAMPHDGVYLAQVPPEGIETLEATVEGELITLHIVFEDGTEKTVAYDYFNE